jgi:DNA-binding transcriptional LysR family regulator
MQSFVGRLRNGREQRNGLSIEPILRERFIAVLPARHRLARNATIRPGDLRMIRLYFSRDGWGPLLLIALSHVVKRKGSGQMLCKKLHSARP